MRLEAVKCTNTRLLSTALGSICDEACGRVDGSDDEVCW